MRVLTIPQRFTQEYEWMTRVITSRDGTEQRIALRQIPRQTFTMEHLADSEETIQSWKYLFISTLLSFGLDLPLWAEAEAATATAGGTTATGDFSLMDNSLITTGLMVMMIHPDGETFEEQLILSKTDTTITIQAGTWASTYPEGSMIVPLEEVFVDNNSGYTPAAVNAASVPIVATAKRNKVLEGYGSAALATYNGRFVLDKVYMPGGGEQFTKNLERIDFGHKVQIETEQQLANLVTGRSYLSKGNYDRQWWKFFLESVKGAQRSFYTSTHRHDMTVVTQPLASALTFQVDDSAKMQAGWENVSSHLHLAFEMGDGSTIYREVDPATTVDAGGGVHTVGVTTAFPTAPEPQHTIVKVSFLELVRIASDKVVIEHSHTSRVVKLTLRTIIE